MKEEERRTSEGLNQIVKMMKAKGDSGELKEITDKDIHKPKDSQGYYYYFYIFNNSNLVTVYSQNHASHRIV